MIPGFTVNPVAAKIAALLNKGAGAPDKCGKVFYGLTGNQNQNDLVGRMDYQLSSKHSLFGRMTTNILTTPTTYDGLNPLTLNTVAVRNAVYTLELGHTWLVSPNTVSAFHISASRTARTINNDNFFSWKDLGSNLAEQAGKTVRLTMTNGGFNLGSVNGVPGAAFTGPNPSVGRRPQHPEGKSSVRIRRQLQSQHYELLVRTECARISYFRGRRPEIHWPIS